ncbi:hypothetical protein FOA43_002484 [Brettanomyces nanus]|uniref:Carbohydrate kinase PfkB domain-containing protein n=1 Tax=Eeniella nana TaxID=13502 RepID=A0A875RPJ9_EENNA|nr:uncharacterized protein FOA43_002484 [Brettanomyces nanus]QPG75140.1 hypothetical protein FOA43_002484 [Brettanomyces nanus]
MSNLPIPVFTSLGLFIVDEIHFDDGMSIHDILGGGGTFGIVGSRMILGKRMSQRCGWVVDVGNDCPPEMITTLKCWNTGAIFRYHEDRKCNHGWNKYGTNDFRQFKFTTPQIDITVKDLLNYKHLLQSKSFHFILSPQNCLDVLTKLEDNAESDTKPVIVWEPDPDDCTNEMLEHCLPVLKRIDVLSPNAAECASFLGLAEPVDHAGCEIVAQRFLPHMSKRSDSAVVLRCGAMGCLLLTRSLREWFPPYHQGSNSIVDPTGCGNTFVGAFATGMVLSGRELKIACICGTLASGASIEQHGVPGLTDGEPELWNGISMNTRAQRYLESHPELEIEYEEFIKKIAPPN